MRIRDKVRFGEKEDKRKDIIVWHNLKLNASDSDQRPRHVGPGRNGGSSGGYSALAVPKTTLARPCLFYWQVSSCAFILFVDRCALIVARQTNLPQRGCPWRELGAAWQDQARRIPAATWPGW